ncbi:pentatricopeptide repeat-containing protein At2g13600-like [Zingiber officinale]|uniref:Pentatricopeptide repeat-containing protein n=1 Tax=Zingiber officinale TaxID=94328 RepID=A0A8J5G8N5_ZINOF|nr:pentatricopeptide repeat-containing protein At2g13600-like [Zingiber officinale]XP_042413763.1 pentatricopeptide repeat-containing protein At2g13600-like [Zingiber officinale]KAG6494035.1 hypothetical protein ZIOFF_049053 [Zingiber officinale]
MPHPNPTAARAAVTSLSRAAQSAKARPVSDATHRDPRCLSAVISGLALDGRPLEALRLFKWFQISALDPDEFTLSNALSLSANLSALDQGRQIQAFIFKKNLPMDVAATNSLINLYFKCGSVADAEKVFDGMLLRDVYTWTAMVSGYAHSGKLERAMTFFETMPARNTVSWNSMINAYQREGCHEMALELFSIMKTQGEALSELTFVAVLKACASLQQLNYGEGVHCCLVKLGWVRSMLVGSVLMDIYTKCGGLQEVQKVFNDIGEHNVISWSILLGGYAQNGSILEAEVIFKEMPEKNVRTWNLMIDGYVRNGMLDNAFELFVDMLKVGMKPNSFTFTSLISGCSNPEHTRIGKKFHGYVVKGGLESETPVCSSLITMYGEHRNIGDACSIFDMMVSRDVVSWTAMVAAYISYGNLDAALDIFDRMPSKNLISWNTMMFGHLQKCRSLEFNSLNVMRNPPALLFFYRMEKSSVRANHFSYNCALSVCANIGALEQARAIHCRTVRRGYESDLGVGNALITVYGKCGALDDAEVSFKSLIYPDMISWNALLTGYSQNGHGDKVLDIYEKMQKSEVAPNHVTFINLLSACSHLGMIEKGLEFFKRMEKDHNVKPTREHYTCIVDLLGRAGYLREAESVIGNMQIVPDAVVWGALLGACKMHGDPEMGKRAADQIVLLEPDNSSALVALAETFAAANMWKYVVEVRTLMKEKKLLKEPGISSIEIRNQSCMFLSADPCRQEKDCIHDMLNSLYGNMIEGNYTLDSELVAFG